jgi:hypothetical protein
MFRYLPRLAALIILAVALHSAPAAAYPQWQLSTGAERCNQCHYAPAGGGLLNTYGRDAAGEELASFGGNGAFLHGLGTLPPWLALGGDLRGAFVAQDVQDPSGPTVAAFPMQADAQARVAIPDTGLSLSGTIGLRGQVRDPGALIPLQNYQPVSTSRLVSREHYLMYQPEAVGPYIRLGRFFAPFGLRFAEHIFYVRRDLGFDQLRETYNLSAGVVRPGWELHVSLFAPDFVREIGSDETGASAYYEKRVADGTAAFGLQGRVASSAGITRLIAGVVGKTWVEPVRTLFFAEVDGVTQLFDAPNIGARHQIVAAAGFTLLPLPGLMATVLGEHNQIDVSFPDEWTAADALVSWFPYAHFELQALARLQHPTGGDDAKTFLFQLHYFL